MPPSPWLSARMTSARYLIEMMTIERPERDRGDPERVGLHDGQVLVLERLPERVQRARADVAEHHAERTEGQRAASGGPVSDG